MKYTIGDVLTCKSDVFEDDTEYCSADKTYNLVDIEGNNNVFLISTNIIDVSMRFTESGLDFWFSSNTPNNNFDYAMGVI